MAQFDDDSIVVYQAYRTSIAKYALEHQRFGGDFSYSRMSWIKPNFLWMMFRSGWAQKEGQEHVLAVRLRRAFFDEILENCVATSFRASGFSEIEDWKTAGASSDVRLQWDPDHDPAGNCLDRRAVQLGLRGDTLRRYGNDEVISITDISDLIAQQHEHLTQPFNSLLVPAEKIYSPSAEAGQRIALDDRHQI